ncbi:MAG TPA: hypothetical protein VM554_10920 [Acidisarcina sp.]|nr:hypothetical protein [Acidisarcina sp.]
MQIPATIASPSPTYPRDGFAAYYVTTLKDTRQVARIEWEGDQFSAHVLGPPPLTARGATIEAAEILLDYRVSVYA